MGPLAAKTSRGEGADLSSGLRQHGKRKPDKAARHAQREQAHRELFSKVFHGDLLQVRCPVVAVKPVRVQP
jgi:hypothetical protein